MNKQTYLLALLFAFIFGGCEDPISVKTDTAIPRLVVDAALKWEKGTAGNEQTIKLTLTANYFAETLPVVSGATVFVNNSVGTTFNFLEEVGTGIYKCSTFIPQIDETYTLTVRYNGETFTANETLHAVPAIDYIAQETIPGIQDTQEQIEIRAYFTDQATTDDFYLFRYQSSVTAIPEFITIDDEFFQGNQVFGLYLNEELDPGESLIIELSGISERYFRYMEKLINLSGNNGPFSVPGGTLRGNVVNSTHPDNYALGFFSVSEIALQTYTVGPF